MTGSFTKKGSIVIVALCALFLLFNTAWAKYEIEDLDVRSSVSTGVDPKQGPSENLKIEWDKPTMDQGDVLVKYIYLLNNSDASLDEAEFDSEGADDEVSAELDNPFLEISKDFFASDNYDTHWYVHVKTAYIVGGQGAELSDDTVVGPFNFDNVPPTGTVRLDTEVDGQTSTTSSVNPVTLKLTASFAQDEGGKVYLSNTSTRPSSAKDFAATLQHEVSEGEGDKNIYYWFEDEAGNISSVKTLSFELIAGKSMQPADDVTLEVGATRTFTILGAGESETFDWSIINAAPAGVASFVGDSQGVASAEVEGDEEGSFKVKATSKDDAAEYTSGTITVVKTFNLDVDGNGEVGALSDGVLIVRYLLDFPSFQGAAWADGAIGNNAARNASEIEQYISGGVDNLAVDVDGNAEAGALSDGVLIVRYLLDFPSFQGAEWADGAIGNNATKNASEIENYVKSLED